ncbi:MAG: gamma-glutamyltransferase, partial [bacterium]|nr:gamma-glutamyltransferase [bacterium]
VQPELAATLERIAAAGSSGFYEGETARRLAAEMRSHGGLITEADLLNYEVVERQPIIGNYRGHEILTAPPPSSGGVGLLQMLGMLEQSDYEQYGHGSAATVHYMAEVMRRFYADRSEHLADPNYHRVPVERLLSKAYIKQRRSSIDRERASSCVTVSPSAPQPGESLETTHISI